MMLDNLKKMLVSESFEDTQGDSPEIIAAVEKRICHLLASLYF